jgi:hypothetical protein
MRENSSANDATRMTMMNPRKYGPSVLSPNAWTDDRIPERVRNVPNSASVKVMITSTMFQMRSIPRRSCTITECRKAVATSHGMRAAFSTGSQAQ